MRTALRWAAFLVLIALALPLVAADDKKADDKKPAPDKKADDKKPAPDKKADDKKPAPEKKPVDKKVLDKAVNTEKSMKAGELTGKIMAVIESKKSVRLQLTLQVPQINQGEVQAAANEEIQYKLSLANRDANSARQHLYNLQFHQARMWTMQNITQDVELQTTEDVKVRLANPPPKYDDKGRVVRYSAKELKELKGDDPKLPGYHGEFSDLAQEQYVTVTLVKKKGDGPRLPQPRAKGKDADQAALPQDLPPVSMILVIIDPNATQGK
jgi:hypothetical protein